MATVSSSPHFVAPAVLAVSDTNPSLTERLAKHLCRPVPKNVQDRARLHLLDWLGCVAGARRSDVAAVVRAAEPDVLTRAAFLGNVLEMDDVHRAAILHPGPVVWPAALSAAREAEAPFAAMLDGGVRGYEAVIAIGCTLDARHYALWHNSSTAGGFGSAAAAGSIFGLDTGSLVAAFGNIGSIAGGLWHMRHAPVMTKQLHVAQAAASGLWIARLARHGFTGSRGILEGAQGFYTAMTERPDPLALDEGWRLHQVSFKPWAACRHSHPAIDAALELKARGALHGPVSLETYADAIAFCDRPEPRTVIEAKFSLQHSIAVVALRGEPRPEDYEPDAIADPELAAFRAAVQVAEAPDITARYPAHFGARLTAGGETVELADTRGDPERPLPVEGVLNKARSLIVWGGLPEREADRAIALALEGDSVADIVVMLEDWT
nr:MmgE/PrpD family protein [Pelagerythrobacter marinus]